MGRAFRRRWSQSPQSYVLLLIVLLVVWRAWQSMPPPSLAPGTLAEGVHPIRQVIDGDTLLLDHDVRVRLIGVDTPETVKPDFPVEPWGPEASDFAKRFLAAREARFAFDRERVDRYGRVLAYVYATDPATGQERLLNEELLRAGLGRALLKFPYSEQMKKRFRRAEQEAREARRGIWSGGS